MANSLVKKKITHINRETEAVSNCTEIVFGQ